MDLEEIADQLYGLDPEEFTATRDDFVRRAADPSAKKAMKGLRKPTSSAHAVNQLNRTRGEDVDALVALGDEMRAAMGGDPAEVRRLTERRRALIADLVDSGLPTAVQQDVTATLEAATADPELGAAVRSGRLVKPLRYAGFGTAPDLDDALATPIRASDRQPRKTSAKKAAAPKVTKKSAAKSGSPKSAAPKQTAATASRAEDADVAAARDRVLVLAGAADDAQRRYEQAARAAVEARTLLDRAEAERAEARKAARAAHAEVEKARRDLGRLERS